MLLGILDLIRLITCHLFRTRPVAGGDVDGCASGSVGTKGEEIIESTQLSETVNKVKVTTPTWSIISISDEKIIIYSNFQGDELYFDELYFDESSYRFVGCCERFRSPRKRFARSIR